jgi:dipeptidyl aminopeptidase/acylaminoacyl peptidase
MTAAILTLITRLILIFTLLIAASILVGRAMPSAQFSHSTLTGPIILRDLHRFLSVPIVPKAAIYSAITWSPRGQILLYVHERRLIAFDLRSHHMEDLTAAYGLSYPEQLSWSPDEASFVYSDRGILTRIDLRSGARFTLTTHTPVRDRPRWSPDGTQIAFLIDDQLYLTDPAFITQTLIAPITPPTAALTLYWSPDQQQIVITSDAITIEAVSINERLSRQLYLTDSAIFRVYPLNIWQGSDAILLQDRITLSTSVPVYYFLDLQTRDRVEPACPDYPIRGSIVQSPDQQTLVYVSQHSLVTCDLTTGRITRLADHAAVEYATLAWRNLTP